MLRGFDRTFVPNFPDNVLVSSSRVDKFLDCLNTEDRTDTLSRNIGNLLPTNADRHYRKAKYLALNILYRFFDKDKNFHLSPEPNLWIPACSVGRVAQSV
jgi:hypothetical protein